MHSRPFPLNTRQNPFSPSARLFHSLGFVRFVHRLLTSFPFHFEHFGLDPSSLFFLYFFFRSIYLFRWIKNYFELIWIFVWHGVCRDARLDLILIAGWEEFYFFEKVLMKVVKAIFFKLWNVCSRRYDISFSSFQILNEIQLVVDHQTFFLTIFRLSLYNCYLNSIRISLAIE